MLLETIQQHVTMTDRLIAAVERIKSTLEMQGAVDLSKVSLRPEQVGVYADFIAYLADTTRFVQVGVGCPMGRIVLPPRTGKTVIAGQIAAGSGLMTTFIVPTKVLVEQAAKEFRRQLPDIPVGVYYGEGKELAIGGINVTTYSILQYQMKVEGSLPWQIYHSALVFADEAHQAMTPSRMRMLREGFDPMAIRIALTATPHYNEERTLGRFFPDLIHEITVAEAVELNLLAPLRVWVYEVDVDASQVAVVAGDLQGEQLGKLMSAAPFFEATRMIRYSEDNVGTPTLICCASRAQAYELTKFLRDRRPIGTPPPEVLLGETKHREEILDRFERGKIDTLINVGVLIQGWSSERCKLLIDLAPSFSPVRALQKFFRPMTKFGSAEARIYLLIPKYLAQMPVLPMELFGWLSDSYESGELIGPVRKPNASSSEEVKPYKRFIPTQIQKVQLVSQVKIQARFERPKLNPKNLEQVRAVLASNSEFNPEDQLGGVHRFRWLLFNHDLFTGRGEQLLRFLGVTPNRAGFVAFMAKLFPDSAAARFFQEQRVQVEEGSCYADALYMEQMLLLPKSKAYGFPEEGFELGWKALAGPKGRDPDEDGLEEQSIYNYLMQTVLPLLDGLAPREKEILCKHYGIGFRVHTLREVGEELEISVERARQIEIKAIEKLRDWLEHKKFRRSGVW